MLPILRATYSRSRDLLAGAAVCFTAGMALGAAQGPSVRPTWTDPEDHIALRQAALDAGSDTTALIVASHPDDRYVAPAAYLHFASGWNVAILLMTRGEGGQNSRGPEIGDELGWLRTLESEAGAALLDARVWYLNRQDAGFCRTAAEAIELWGRNDTLVALARLLRTIRPDVVITTHHPDEDHGHDQAVLELLPQAMELAADPETSIADLPPVRVARAFRGPSVSEIAAVQATLPLEAVDAVRGQSYRKLAYAAVLQHKTQEPIRPLAEMLDPTVPLYPWRKPESAADWTLADLPSLFTLVDRDPALRRLEQDLKDLAGNIAPADLLERAVNLHIRLQALTLEPGSDAEARRLRRLAALQRVIRHAAPLRLRIEVPEHAVAVHGESLPITVHVHNGSHPWLRPLALAGVGGELDLDAGASLEGLLEHSTPTLKGRFFVPRETGTRRAWLARIFSADTFEPPLRIVCRTAVIRPQTRRAAFEFTHETFVPMDVRPRIELRCTPAAMLRITGREREALTVRLLNHSTAADRTLLEVLTPPGFAARGSPATTRLDRAVADTQAFEVVAPIGLEPDVYNLHVKLGAQRAIVPFHVVDAEINPELRVGLVRGVDDNAENVLRAFVGPNLALLDEDALAAGVFGDLDTIVIDIRALREQVTPGIWSSARAAFPRFLDFVQRGGRLVVLYHKDTDFNPDVVGFEGAPFPLRIGKGRVTREDAPVEVLVPEHPLLTQPNRIRLEDWDGWVQERGLYFPDRWAPEYQAILSMHDRDQPPAQGALLYARYGSGEFVYCALAIHRQLNSLHPGAVRLFANLASADRTKGVRSRQAK